MSHGRIVRCGGQLRSLLYFTPSLMQGTYLLLGTQTEGGEKCALRGPGTFEQKACAQTTLQLPFVDNLLVQIFSTWTGKHGVQIDAC